MKAELSFDNAGTLHESYKGKNSFGSLPLSRANPQANVDANNNILVKKKHCLHRLYTIDLLCLVID
jgi:hypothetical protein